MAEISGLKDQDYRRPVDSLVRSHYSRPLPARPRDLTLGDAALSTKPVMLILALLIPATRWSCSQQPLLSAGGRLQHHLVAGIRGVSDMYHIGNIYAI